MSLLSWHQSALPTFSRGGIHPAEPKEITENLPIEDFIPASVSLPVSQSLGPSAEPVVAINAKVKRGDVIATVPGGVSLHAPVSGIVKSVQSGPHASLVYDRVITIQAQPAEDDPQFPEQPGWQALPVAQMLERIRDAGVVGLGGAAFPTYRKLTLPKDAKVDTLVINGSECEPYLTCDYRLMLEESEKVVLGSWLIARIIGVVALIVSDTLTLSMGMPSNATSISRSESIAIPTRPTSPSARGSSESSPICVGKSNATLSAFCPCSIRNLKRPLVSWGVPKPAYCRIVHGRARYISG